METEKACEVDALLTGCFKFDQKLTKKSHVVFSCNDCYLEHSHSNVSVIKAMSQSIFRKMCDGVERRRKGNRCPVKHGNGTKRERKDEAGASVGKLEQAKVCQFFSL